MVKQVPASRLSCRRSPSSWGEESAGSLDILSHVELPPVPLRRRLAEELRCPLGQQVGYRIRFQDTTSASTLIRLMTDGIMLAETQTDRFLDQYDTIIVDEAHERSLNIDFLLGYLRRLLPRRRDLKLIITSATIDAQRFSEHFTIKHQAARC